MPISNDFNLLDVSMIYMFTLHGFQYSILEELVATLGIARWLQTTDTDIQRFACSQVRVCLSVCLWSAEKIS